MSGASTDPTTQCKDSSQSPQFLSFFPQNVCSLCNLHTGCPCDLSARVLSYKDFPGHGCGLRQFIWEEIPEARVREQGGDRRKKPNKVWELCWLHSGHLNEAQSPPLLTCDLTRNRVHAP